MCVLMLHHITLRLSTLHQVKSSINIINNNNIVIVKCTASVMPLSQEYLVSFSVSSEKKYSFRGAIRFLYRTVKNEGVLVLWRGNSATMARIVPYAAIQYSAHEQWKLLLNPGKEK